MSDVLATAWVLAALLLGLKAWHAVGAAIAAGAALGVAVLVRPTDILAAIPLAFALPPSRKAFLATALGALPLVVLLALYDLVAFGNAADTGYGAILSWTMSWSHLLPQIRHYGRWVPALLTPLLPLAWLLLPFDRRAAGRDRLFLFTWFGAFLGFYLFYEPYEDWWSTRFLLPGIPALIVSSLLLARDIRDRFQRATPRAVYAAGLALLALPIAVGIFHIRRFDLLSMWRGEAVYRDASRYAVATVPGDSLIVSMQMSGALKYYTKLPIARWDAIRPERFPALRRAVEERGLRWHALLWTFEEESFRKNLPGRWTRIGAVRDIGLWRLE